MKTATIRTLLSSLLAVTLLSGCVLGERKISLSVPKGARPPVRGDVAIGSVVDARKFEDKPSDPATPSVDGKVASKTPAERARLVGRQRNTYGMAMGGIGLSGARTMPEVMRDLVSEAFARNGYETRPGSRNRVDVRVEKFWAWSTPGMWSIGFEARLEAILSYRGRRLHVHGEAYNGGQMAKNANWEEAYEGAFEAFLKDLSAQLDRGGS